MSPLVPGWEKTLQGNAEVEGKERLHVVVSLPAPNVEQHSGVHRGIRTGFMVSAFGGPCKDMICGVVGRRVGGGSLGYMVVLGHLVGGEGVGFFTALLTQGVSPPTIATAHVDRRAAPKVREGKRGTPIAPIGRSKQRVERLILIDGQDLPIAKGPTPRGEVKAHDTDFGQEWL
jgi:hypothetical protein